MYVKRISCAVALAIVSVACGGKTPASPAGPSPLTGPSAPLGATILGTVHGGTTGLAVTTGSAMAGLTVTVVGTDISATVNGTGQFTLVGVPAGSTQLRFSGQGVDATVAITPVQGTGTITITVNISGSRGEVEDEAHEDNGKAEVNGTISDLSGTAASFQFKIGSRVVRGDSQTEFFGDGNRSDDFSDLQNGRRVEVKGLSREGFVYAQRLHVNQNSGHGSDDDEDDDHDNDDDDDGDEDEDEDADEVEIKGTLSGLGGTCPSLTFSVSGSAVATNGSTEFSKGGCSALRNGDRVKVEGMRQASGVLLAREVKRD